MSLQPPAQGRPWRIAVVGSGPSGFYAVQALHRLRDFPVQVDLFDRLPTPFGLVRGGVAPDHQNIKAVTRSYDRQAARTEGLRFFGNVQVGRDLSVADLESLYDATIWANGHEGARTLGIPGEDLDGVASAAHFVFWYNGHPDHVDRSYPLGRAQKAVVVGNGNVAIDVARILSQDPERLALTDIAQHALDQLRGSAVRSVDVLGRRGPEQASFTPTELAELAELPCLDLRVGADGVAEAHPDEADAAVRKNIELLSRQASREPLDRPRSIRLRFFVSPIAFVGDDQGRLRAVRLARNALVARGGRLSAQPTGEVWEEPCQLALTAIGYRGLQIPGMPFDPQLGRMPSEAGRVLAAPGAAAPGHYVVGWARRGPPAWWAPASPTPKTRWPACGRTTWGGAAPAPRHRCGRAPGRPRRARGQLRRVAPHRRRRAAGRQAAGPGAREADLGGRDARSAGDRARGRSARDGRHAPAPIKAGHLLPPIGDVAGAVEVPPIAHHHLHGHLEGAGFPR